MADRYWVGTTTSWNTASNWSATSGGAGGAGVPTSSDDVIFDGNGLGNCTLDVNAVANSISATASYTGTLDFSTYNVNCVDSVTWSTGGMLDIGSGIVTVGGNWSTTSITFLYDTNSELRLTGSSKTLELKHLQSLYDINIVGSYTSSNNTLLSIFNKISITGAYTKHLNTLRAKTVDIGNGASLSASILWISNPASGQGIIQNNGEVVCSSYIQILHPAAGTVLAGGVFTAPYFQIIADFTGSGHQGGTSAVITITNDIVINGDLKLDTDGSGFTLTIDNSVNNIDWTVTGDISQSDTNLGAGTTWTKGTGTITLSGSANQNIDFDGESVEDIVIDKTAGTVTLTGGVVTDSLTLTSGTLDCGSQTLETVGNFTMAAGTTVTET